MEKDGSGGCPAMAFRYNGTLCACEPGRYLVNGSCALFETGGGWVVSSGVSSAPPTFLTTVLPVDSIKRFTQSQAVLLEATLGALLVWLAFCLALRFTRVDGGRCLWFRLRWWISRSDMFYDTNHWLDDNKAVIKRKTELGGTFSVASSILFVGLLSALLYQIITKRSIEVHRVRPANAPDLLSFVNDLEFSITTISSMSCSHLRGPDSLVIGTPGSIDYRVFPLSTYVEYNCQNTSSGPIISLRCNSCQIPRRNHYISWQFVDLRNDPAAAVGFRFNLSAKDHANNRHVSFVSGTVKSNTYTDDKPKTFRGSDVNVLKIHLFPQAYNNLNLIQPLFHDFIPGTFFSKSSDLQASLQVSKDGLVNTTLYISYLSDYIVEIDKENMIGIVGFLADVGGLFTFSLAIFLWFLIQCEARIKKLRYEDTAMRNILRQRRAQKNWDKLRKFVMYTWGPSKLVEDNNKSRRHGTLMIESIHGIQAFQSKKQSSRHNSTHLDTAKGNSPHSKSRQEKHDIEEEEETRQRNISEISQ
ncbi:uncharacterized protein LOC103979365 isoform X1 [Musa acuminata AAA Group]|uniref:uncharacterized protein LOC103979365 isoform X1 n=1 Tax=Musa acuminata AAA Group TaxID=214697 RepID=UPI0031D0B02F